MSDTVYENMLELMLEHDIPVEKVAEVLRIVGQIEAERRVLVNACRMAQGAMAAHGPCSNNSCSECKATWDRLRSVLARHKAEVSS